MIPTPPLPPSHGARVSGQAIISHLETVWQGQDGPHRYLDVASVDTEALMTQGHLHHGPLAGQWTGLAAIVMARLLSLDSPTSPAQWDRHPGALFEAMTPYAHAWRKADGQPLFNGSLAGSLAVD